MPIDEITIHPRDNDMILATHGRSIWILDDLTPIQHAAAALATDATLFDIRPAMTFFDAPEDRPRWLGDRPFWGTNPTFGAALSFYLKQPADGRPHRPCATRTVRRSPNSSGDATAGARHAGINRVYWDLRHQPLPFPKIPGEQRPGPTTYFDDPLPGPFVLAGEYRVTLTVDGKDCRDQQPFGSPTIGSSPSTRPIVERGTTPHWRCTGCSSPPTKPQKPSSF